MSSRASPQQSKTQSPHHSLSSSWLSGGVGGRCREHRRVLATCLLVVVSFAAWAFGPGIIDAGTKWTAANMPTTAGTDFITRQLASPTPSDAHSVKEEPIEDEPVAKVVNYDGVKSFSLDRAADVHLTVSYKSSGNHRAGLFNQHIAHEHAFMLAVALKAGTLMWPPSRERGSYNSGGSRRWRSIDSSKIYDIEHIQSFAKEKYDMRVVKVPNKRFQHKFEQPNAKSNVGGYVTLLDASGKNVPGKHVVLDMAIHSGHQDLQEVAEHVNEKIEKLLNKWGGEVEGVPEVGLVLDAPFFLLRDAPKDIAVPVMTNLLFAPNLRGMAEDAVHAAKDKTGSESFNGLHLRVEDDAAVFASKVGGNCGILAMHNKAMAKAGFTATVPVFVASAIYSVKDTSPGNLEKVIMYSADLMCKEFASSILTKDMLLPSDSLQELGPEELAVVDWLILKHSRLAVGWAASTFSLSLRERRVMEGPPEATTRLVQFDWSSDKATLVPEECQGKQ